MKHYKSQLGGDYLAYRNHAHRVAEYARILMLQKESKKFQIVAAFHDLDIWVSGGMDYLGGSSQMAKKYLKTNRINLLADEIEFMISNHHKLTKIKGAVEAEAFRKADLIDLSAGIVPFNIPKSLIVETEKNYPRNGFTKKVILKTIKWALSHPFRPFPMIKF